MRYKVSVFAVKGPTRTLLSTDFVVAADQKEAEQRLLERVWAPADPTHSPAFETTLAPMWLAVADFDIDERRYARFVFDLDAGKLVTMDKLVVSDASHWVPGEAEELDELSIALGFTDLLTHPYNWDIATLVRHHQDLPEWAKSRVAP
ncbi:hypothetical protein AB4Y45_34810 [Paraburkholderia sp. EG287A]|uniref:hypothetical protein n=1 Tax=Paraburkholderia sp. EG287A TaxID=3237012 RepID=UPI0034D15AEB